MYFMAIGFENPTTCLFRTTHLLILENCPLNMLIQDHTVIRATRVNNILSDAGTEESKGVNCKSVLFCVALERYTWQNFLNFCHTCVCALCLWPFLIKQAKTKPIVRTTSLADKTNHPVKGLSFNRLQISLCRNDSIGSE